jgi:hypothetical protein
MNQSTFEYWNEILKRVCVRDPWVLYPNKFPTVRLHFGGDGLYSSPRDYLSLLRHILEILGELFLASFHVRFDTRLDGTAANPVLSKASLHHFFTPTLTPEGQRALCEMFHSPQGSLQFSFALAIQTQDRGPEKMSAGSGWCKLSFRPVVLYYILYWNSYRGRMGRYISLHRPKYRCGRIRRSSACTSTPNAGYTGLEWYSADPVQWNPGSEAWTSNRVLTMSSWGPSTYNQFFILLWCIHFVGSEYYTIYLL